jgi:YidC/Oxa1 family membrane protein insertase
VLGLVAEADAKLRVADYARGARPGVEQLVGQSAYEQADVVMADPKFQEQIKRVSDEMEAVISDPNLQGFANRIEQQVQAAIMDPALQEEAKRVAEGMEAMMADPDFQQQAKAFVEIVGALKAGPDLQEQARGAAKQLEALMASPKLQEQTKHIAEQARLVAEQMEVPEELSVAPRVETAQEPTESGVVDDYVDNLVDKLFDRTLKASPSQQADLEDASLAHPRRLAIPGLRTRGPTSAHSHAARRWPISGAQKQPGQERSPSEAAQWKKGLDKLSTEVYASAIATAVMLLPSVALAEEAAAPLSPFQKVDKTGVIGGAASIIENGIELAHNGLANSGLTSNTYGISICLFTLLIRTLTLPLTQAQLESTTKMQQIQPLTKKIQALYCKKSQEEQKQKLTAELYQAANINPLAGCVPALVQIPVFISLYRALTNLCAEDQLSEGFLWLPSLEGPIYGASTSNWFSSIFSGNPALGWPDTLAFLSLPAILIATQTASSRIMQPQTGPGKTPQEQASQNVIKFLPFLIAGFSINVPAGLSVYWIVNNIVTTAITVAVRSGIKAEDLPPEAMKMMADLEAREAAQAEGLDPALATVGGEARAASPPSPSGAAPGRGVSKKLAKKTAAKKKQNNKR